MLCPLFCVSGEIVHVVYMLPLGFAGCSQLTVSDDITVGTG